MKHWGLAIDLHDDEDSIAAYEAFHRAPWPEALDGLREVGVLQMRIFRLGPHLFMHMVTTDTFDPGRDLGRYVEQNPKAAEWDALMRTFQTPVAAAAPGEWWAFMAPVFDLDDHVAPSPEQP